MRYDPSRQELVLKIVYYGPGMAGKTTSLQELHRRLPEDRRSEFLTVDTHSERTILFDFLAVELGKIQGYPVRLELHTVPGQSYYAATRRQILDHADGVLFVADSRREALDENIESMNEMLANLRQINPNRVLDGFPVVLQFNKQDLPTAVPPNQLGLLMNVGNWPTFSSVAVEGKGVSEPCLALATRLAESLADIEVPAIGVPAPSTWLITCFRCQKMMEMSARRLTLVQECPACSTPFIVVDADRGLTEPPRNTPARTMPVVREPTPARVPVPLAMPVLEATPLNVPQAVELASSGGDEPVVLPEIIREEALERRAPAGDPAAATGPSPIAGFTVVATLDESPMGVRLRLREEAGGALCRVLVLNPALASDAGYADGIEPWVRQVRQVGQLRLLRPTEVRQLPERKLGIFTIDAPDHESLRDVLARRRVLAPPHAISIIRQLAQILAEAAKSGLCHGYLRPEVILLTAAGEVLVDEIGVPHPARWLVKESQSVSAGAEYYIAPEYLGDGTRPDVRSDIFLLGCLLFRMLTGEGLVTGYNGHEALHKLMSTGPRLLRDVQADISRDLSNLHQRMVAIDRRERIADHEELIRLLDRFGGGAQPQALSLTRHIQRPPSDRWTAPEPTARPKIGSDRFGRIAPPPPAPSAFPTVPHRKSTAANTATRTTARFDRGPGQPPAAPERPSVPEPIHAGGGLGGVLLVAAVVIAVAAALITLLRSFAH